MHSCVLADVGHSRSLATGELASTKDRLGTARYVVQRSRSCRRMLTCSPPRSYNPPEFQMHRQHTRRVDMYHAGHVIYMMLIFHARALRAAGEDLAGKSILDSNRHFVTPLWEQAALRDAPAGQLRKDFIETLMHDEASRRGRAREALNHPWLRLL